ncbi:tyrosine-type recombinase/integrase, partial [Enterobacter chengduensis]|uniref:tyrosine-type recombinase/integrase n=1 Tax=Enterobacter chengduensis TaxID=2494701 RepID=UPI00254CE267
MRKTRSQLGTLMHIINGDTPVSTIRHSDILKYRKELLNGEALYLANPRSNKQGRTVRTVNNYISLLCSLLRFAHKSGFISGKPFEGIKKLHKGKVKPDPLTKQEFSLLAASERGQSLNMWTFAVYTGVRHGEIAALAWEEIDWEKGTAHIQRNLNALGMFGPPKTEAGNRVITLLEPALEALKAQRKLTALQPKTEIVFNHREYGSVEHQSLRFVFIPRMRKGEQKAYYSLSSIGARFNAAVKRAGIRRRNPYHTRHTFACWLLSAGANPSFIASQMGHENAQMVYEVYGAWIEEMNGEQVLMLNDKLAR